jgi:hypothetical protein
MVPSNKKSLTGLFGMGDRLTNGYRKRLGVP